MSRAWGGRRAGAGNPFAGRKHTPEWKAAQSARQFTWTAEELTTLRRWYLERESAPLKLAELAALLGRTKATVSRMAGQLGLSRQKRATGRKPTAKYATIEESRAAIGAAAKKRIAEKGHPRGALGMRHSPETRAKMSEAVLARPKPTPAEQEARTEKALATKLARYGTYAPGMDADGNPYSRTRYGRREDLGGQFFRSSWEANYARYLNFLKAQYLIRDWEYEADTFWFEAIRRGVRSYKPDFKVTDWDGSIHYDEVKGWLDAKSKTKLARMAKYHPTVDLRLIDEKAYREIERNFSGAIPNWERQKKSA